MALTATGYGYAPFEKLLNTKLATATSAPCNTAIRVSSVLTMALSADEA